ncbi:hypothetical protein EW026_g2803 [Hermanssonia centrifuga]|uniref:Proteasome subunit alpha type n=1 Tax=Hermanssonia centrifuga TaxID=98765 RepID=A0A4S4KM19_9APHY|nr:hypothetical protein EW026_g2803 [Hermanssonia centrifuga]
MSIGARSQSAKTYLEKHYESFMDCNLEELIRHGLHALRETLQQDKELTINNTSIGIIGPVGAHEKTAHPDGPFRILEGEDIEVYLKGMTPKESAEGAPGTTTAADAPAGQTGPPPPTGDDDVQMAD